MNGGVFLAVNASGAVAAAKAGHIVMVVDVIDMSTSLEAALDAGALRVFGASPDRAKAPVPLNPGEIGRAAGRAALAGGTDVILIAEPRVGPDHERMARCNAVISGIREAGAEIGGVFPNIGAETAKLGSFAGKVAVAVSDTGGVAFDAAFNACARLVLTGTVARTLQKRGFEPARAAAQRAVTAARTMGTGIAVVAASANSLEDVLAAEYIYKQILEEGFTKI